MIPAFTFYHLAMIDVKLLREELDHVKAGVARKKFSVDFEAIAACDKRRRVLITEAEQARARQNEANQAMAALPKGSPAFLEKVKELKTLSAEVKAKEVAAREIEQEWQQLLLTVPNIPHPSVPEGRGDQDNQTVFSWEPPVAPSACAKPHWDIPWFARLCDFERGVKVTGAGFPFMVGDLARLVRALIQFFLDEAAARGYEEVMPPILVNPASATATGQLPDKEGQMYHAPQDDLYLIPTAEVPVTNFFRNEIVDESQLPLKRCAYTPCFRREAGSWGKDVRGLNRLHQFDKVELVKWVHPSTSFEALDTLRDDAESLLQQLGLPYRRLLICSGDIGFPHAKQYDLEVWAAGQQRWLEVSSCSNFTDFQARRAAIRFRPQQGGKPEILHTLNGSALAVPRVLAAILENNLQDDGRVMVPAVLRRYFDRETIGA